MKVAYLASILMLGTGGSAACRPHPVRKAYQMSIFKQSRRSRPVASPLFPAKPEVAAPEIHGCCAMTSPVVSSARNGRLRYRSTPFYLKIEGLAGPRQSLYV